MKTNEAATSTENAAVAEQGAQVAPENAASKKKASQKKGAPKSRKAAKGARKTSVKTANRKRSPARQGSKKQIVIDLLSRKDGATMAEIAKATGWQNHSIRGFISGTLTKKMDLPVASLKNSAGQRVYRIER
jgi:hypothetical protein